MVVAVRARRAVLLVVALFAAALALPFGCGEPTSGAIEGVYVVPASLDELSEATFFDHPFPSDLRLEGGRVRMLGWPNPRKVPLLEEYIGYIDGKLDGFSPVAAGFMRFSGALDPASLPDAAASTDPGASVQLIDIDPASPARGTRRPIYLLFRKDPGVYWDANTLAFMPVPGFPLRTRTQYALVVTDDVLGEGGVAVNAPATLRQVLGLAPSSGAAVESAKSKLSAAVASLGEAGVAPDRVVQLAVFTTNDPAAEFMAAAGALPTAAEAPIAAEREWTLRLAGGAFDEYEGSFGPLPNYQAGELPFTKFGDGGGFVLDDSGVPQVQDTYQARFSLSVPKEAACPMPADGYPIVLYAHGTTGDYRSYVSDGTAASLTSECLAVMGVDQILHGTRPGAPESDTSKQILFFNFNNIEAARTNIQQSGLDEIQRARLFTDSAMSVPWWLSVTGAEIHFDASRLTFFGHSQGSLNGPLFLAGSAAPRGAVLSGASAVMQITLLEKTKPEPSIANLVKTIFLQLLIDEQGEVGLLYPPIALAQSIVDPVDPTNYAALMVNEPVFGAPKSIYMTEGVGPDGAGDSYAPPRGCEALAMAIGLPFQTPVVHSPLDAFSGEPELVTIPEGGLTGNLASGAASGVLAQWQPGDGDGHFVVFDIAGATLQAARFLRNLSDDPKGRVPAP